MLQLLLLAQCFNCSVNAVKHIKFNVAIANNSLSTIEIILRYVKISLTTL